MSIVAGSGLNGKHIYHCSEAVFFQNHSNTIYQNNILNSSYLFFTNYLYILQDLECLPPRILRLDHFFCNIQEISSLGVRLMQRNSNMLRIWKGVSCIIFNQIISRKQCGMKTFSPCVFNLCVTWWHFISLISRTNTHFQKQNFHDLSKWF